MKSIRNILLISACISFVIVLGGAVYEHLNMVPRWKLAPPASLTMFQGPYGIDAARFWKLIHPITLTLMLASVITNWKTARRKYILVSVSAYVLILIITFAYFVPELILITQTPYQPVTNNDLVPRADAWEKLSLVRMVFIFVIAGYLLFALTKGNENKRLVSSS